MSPKTKNWILGSLAIAAFILGMPLVQIALTGAGTAEGEIEHSSPTASRPETATSQAIEMGDTYLRFVRTGDESVSAQLYDSHFNLIATSEDEVALTFSLPNGEKKVFTLTPQISEECSMDEHSSGGGDCCGENAEHSSPAECSHEE